VGRRQHVRPECSCSSVPIHLKSQSQLCAQEHSNSRLSRLTLSSRGRHKGCALAPPLMSNVGRHCMSDYSPAAMWAPLALGSIASLWFGYRMRGPKGCGGVIAAGFLAFGLSVALMFLVGYTWQTCAKAFKLCVSTSDTTVWKIVLYPLAQIPLNWILMLAFPRAAEVAVESNTKQ